MMEMDDMQTGPIAEAESAILPEVAVIDTHHHFWGQGHFGAARFGACLPDDFLAIVAKSGDRLAASVHVDCGWAFRKDGPEHLRCVGETEFVARISREFEKGHGAAGNLCAGIVGKADLMLGEAVEDVLEAHVAAAPDHFRGVRELVAHDPDAYQALNIPAGKMQDPRFRAGFRRLEPWGLSCDLLCVHSMLDEIASLAQEFPHTSIILNHLAGPIGIGRFAGRRAEVLADWRARIASLARLPNVSMKLSGIGADIMGFGWQDAETKPDHATVAEAIAPYVHAAIDAFSPSRCMFGSNWPVDGQSFTYATMWNAFKQLASRYSDDEQRDLFAGTATRLYRLDLPPSGGVGVV